MIVDRRHISSLQDKGRGEVVSDYAYGVDNWDTVFHLDRDLYSDRGEYLTPEGDGVRGFHTDMKPKLDSLGYFDIVAQGICISTPVKGTENYIFEFAFWADPTNSANVGLYDAVTTPVAPYAIAVVVANQVTVTDGTSSWVANNCMPWGWVTIRVTVNKVGSNYVPYLHINGKLVAWDSTATTLNNLGNYKVSYFIDPSAFSIGYVGELAYKLSETPLSTADYVPSKYRYNSGTANYFLGDKRLLSLSSGGMAIQGNISGSALFLTTPYNPFDQSLNKADSPTFDDLTLNGDIAFLTDGHRYIRKNATDYMLDVGHHVNVPGKVIAGSGIDNYAGNITNYGGWIGLSTSVFTWLDEGFSPELNFLRVSANLMGINGSLKIMGTAGEPLRIQDSVAQYCSLYLGAARQGWFGNGFGNGDFGIASDAGNVRLWATGKNALTVQTDGKVYIKPSGSPATTTFDTEIAGDNGLRTQSADGYVLDVIPKVGIYANGPIKIDSTATTINEAGADSDTRVEGDTDANLLYVDAGNDRVGIGVAAPTAKLDVNGNIHVPDDGFIGTNAGVGFSFDNTATAHISTDDPIISDAYSATALRIYGRGVPSTFVVNTATDRVGIGPNTPAASLDCDGDAIFNDSGADKDFRIEGVGSANLFFVDASTARVGIGTNAPQQLFDVAGTAEAHRLNILPTGFGVIASQDITGIYGIVGLDGSGGSTTVNCYGVWANAQGGAAGGATVRNYGGYFLAHDPGGIPTHNYGIYAQAYGATVENYSAWLVGDVKVDGGLVAAVSGTASTELTFRALSGTASYDADGTGTAHNIGVYGEATQAEISGPIHNVGVYGKAENGTTNYAGYFEGDAGVTGQLHLSVASGSAPFVVTSPNVVANLNADLLDGHHASEFLGGGDYVKKDGSTPMTGPWEMGQNEVSIGRVVSADTITGAFYGLKTSLAPDEILNANNLDLYSAYHLNNFVGSASDQIRNYGVRSAVRGDKQNTGNKAYGIYATASGSYNNYAGYFEATEGAGTGNASYAVYAKAVGSHNPYAVFTEGNVYVGTGSLTVEGGAIFNSLGASTSNLQVQGDTDPNLFLCRASTDRVGIGVASPSYKLHVSGSASVSGSLSVVAAAGYALNVTGQGNFSSTLTASSVNSTSFTGSTGGNVTVGNSSTGGIVFQANSAEQMRLTSAGLGIGTGAAPTSKLFVSGSLGMAIKTITGNYTAANEPYIVASGAVTVTLPATSGIAGRLYTVKKVDGTGTIVTVSGSSGNLIDGETFKQINVQYAAMSVITDGAAWWIV